MPVALAKRKAWQIRDSGKIDLCPAVSRANPTFIQSTGSDTTPQTTQTYAQLSGHPGVPPPPPPSAVVVSRNIGHEHDFSQAEKAENTDPHTN